MYSKEVEDYLREKKVKIGDYVEVTKDNIKYLGILMPRIELGDPSSLVIKLDNGYNIGIKFEKGIKIKLVKKGRPIKFEPSKIKPRKDPAKPMVSILGCGGTIAARVEYTTGAVFPAFSP
ncbi:MAG: Glu-tRNA(Gln) amidotransferase GatDE subunit D, partial [Candidatus Aenigmarchaeota archaeon]|nr:Glu-tRNA(Gln) amidotransferase GatDE subunit D [Candidatus Aenigmarchaeota archaeon]